MKQQLLQGTIRFLAGSQVKKCPGFHTKEICTVNLRLSGSCLSGTSELKVTVLLSISNIGL